jgi:hypothetical protein
MDIMNTEIIHIALEHLKKTTKIDGRWDKATDVHLDGQVVFNIDNTTIRFNAEIKKELRNHQLFQLEKTAKQFPPFIIVLNVFSLRSRNISGSEIWLIWKPMEIFFLIKRGFIIS